MAAFVSKLYNGPTNSMPTIEFLASVIELWTREESFIEKLPNCEQCSFHSILGVLPLLTPKMHPYIDIANAREILNI